MDVSENRGYLDTNGTSSKENDDQPSKFIKFDKLISMMHSVNIHRLSKIQTKTI
jgi:hypothetical protein